jgi:hypothetical protein
MPWTDPTAELADLSVPDRRRWVLRHAIDPALAELGRLPSRDRARVMLLAIASVESGCLHRRQMGGGPARGLWQFERTGGCAGVLRHQASAERMQVAMERRGLQATPYELWQAIAGDDVLAAIAARLLLLTDPAPMPGDVVAGRAVYLRTWRPGKPCTEATWWDAWSLAGDTVPPP